MQKTKDSCSQSKNVSVFSFKTLVFLSELKDFPYNNRKEYEKENTYVCITESLCCTPETNTTL